MVVQKPFRVTNRLANGLGPIPKLQTSISQCSRLHKPANQVCIRSFHGITLFQILGHRMISSGAPATAPDSTSASLFTDKSGIMAVLPKPWAIITADSTAIRASGHPVAHPASNTAEISTKVLTENSIDATETMKSLFRLAFTAPDSTTGMYRPSLGGCGVGTGLGKTAVVLREWFSL